MMIDEENYFFSLDVLVMVERKTAVRVFLISFSLSLLLAALLLVRMSVFSFSF